MDDGYFHGINKMKKPGFKVIKPPGGQTQINIFEQNVEVKSSPINPCQAERNSSNVFAALETAPVKSNADRNSSSIVFGGPELPASPTDATKSSNASGTPKNHEKSVATPPPAASNQTADNATSTATSATSTVTPTESKTTVNAPPPPEPKEAATPPPAPKPAADTAPSDAQASTKAAVKTGSNEQNKPEMKKNTDSNTKSQSQHNNFLNDRGTNPNIRTSIKSIAPPGGKSSINLFG